MFQTTPQRRVLLPHTKKWVGLLLLGVFFITLIITSVTPPKVAAVTSNTLNFQARLMTATGGIVPDGNYHIEFKLYNAASSSGSSQGSCSGDAACQWTETRTTGNLVQVKNGYLTVNLGSVTALPNIDYSQQLWLTMRVGGSGGSATWDPEMNPRLSLTAVPYAFKAGDSATLGGISSSGFIQNTTSPQTANIAIQSAGTSSVGALIQGASGQAADILQVKANGVSTPLLSVGSAGAVQLQPTADTTSVFNIKSSLGNNLFTIDSVNSRVGIGVGSNNVPTIAGTGAGLEVKGGLRLSGGGSGYVDQFTTPVGANVESKINVVLYDPANFGQVVSFGLKSTAFANNRVLTLFDARTGAHQPSLAVISPNENQVAGISWDGSNTTALFKNSSDTIALQATSGSALNILTAKNNAGVANVGIGNNASGGYALDVTGEINVSTGYRAAGFAGANGTCSGGQFLQNATIVGGIVTGGTCAAGGSGVTIVGTIDSQTKSADGAVISGTSIYLQSADASNPGLITTGAQTIAGAKTLTGNITATGTYNTNTFTSSALTFGAASTATIQSAASQAINITGNAASSLATTSGTLTLQSNGTEAQIQLFGGSASINLNTGAGGTIGIGNSTTTTVNIGANTNNARTINIGVGTGSGGSQAQTVNIGSTAAGSTTNINGGTGNINLATNAAGAGTIIKNNTNSITGFQVQNASGDALITGDSTNVATYINNGYLNLFGTYAVTSATLSSSGTGGTLAAATYGYGVAAIGANSNKTQTIAPTPSSVTTTGSTSRNTLSWTASSGAKGYRIWRTINGGTTYFYNDVSAATTSIIDNGSTYTWSTTGTPTTINQTSGLNLASDTNLTLDGGSGSFGATLSYSSQYKSLVLGNFNTAGVVSLAGDAFYFQDTTGYNFNLMIANTGATTFRNRLNTTSAFQVQNSAGTTTVLNVDTTNNRVGIGTATPTSTLQVVSTVGPQLTLAYDTTHKVNITSETNGDVLFDGYNGMYIGSYATANSSFFNSDGSFSVYNSAGTALLNAQTSGTTVAIGGNVTATGTYNTNTFTSSALTFGAASTATIQSAASRALNITGNAASTFSTSAGALTLAGAAGVNITGGTANIVLGAVDATTTLFILDNSSAASDPTGINGAMYYSTSKSAFRCYGSGAWTNCGSGLLQSSTSTTADITSCSSACASIGAAAALPANYCQAGRVIHIFATGGYQNLANATVTVDLYYGTNASTRGSNTLVAQPNGPLTLSNNASGSTYYGWQMDAYVTCYSTTSMNVSSTITFNYFIGQNVETIASPTTTTGLVTTSNKNFYIFPSFSSSSTSNRINITQLTVTGM